MVLVIRILLFRVPYQGPLFSETPTPVEVAGNASVSALLRGHRPVSDAGATRRPVRSLEDTFRAVSNLGVFEFGVLIIRILLFRILY